ncbi:STAS domain-containing protein [Sorangium sp. So ce295]|jgi:rsbT co-antagonist protein RsbR|uniref:STAS domain-containing protein n=1 Tax=Sorangium sp. So ce295 TaxID=3133295 RepID=UPI003F5FA4C4
MQEHHDIARSEAAPGHGQPDRSPARLGEIFDQLRDAVIVYRLDGSVADYNARLLEMFEVGHEGVRLFDVVEGSAGVAHPLDPLRKLWPELLSDVHKSFECRPRTLQDGSLLHVECYARKVDLASGQAILVDIHDAARRRRAEEALRESKRQLEQLVLSRTAALQEKIRLIEEQQEALFALSTPVIQVWQGILVLPLVGTVDSRRSQQIMESVLSSIVRTSARELIIDITGVPSVSDEVSRYLLQTIGAARLLGATCSLTGISAEVARSLVALDVDWSSLRISGTLQSGLQAAIARV